MDDLLKGLKSEPLEGKKVFSIGAMEISTTAEEMAEMWRMLDASGKEMFLHNLGVYLDALNKVHVMKNDADVMQ